MDPRAWSRCNVDVHGPGRHRAEGNAHEPPRINVVETCHEHRVQLWRGLPAGSLVDPLSTSWTLIGAEGSLPYVRYTGPRTLTPCTGAQPGVLAAGTWLASALIDGEGQIPSPYSPDETDWNATALATLGLSQSHGSTGALRLGLAALKSNVSAYAESADGDIPAALGTLLMVAHAANANPRDFGGVNLPARLLATVQK